MNVKGRFSILIKPLLYILDLLIISFLISLFLTKDIVDLIFFISFWLFLSFCYSFYKVYRFTKIIKLVSLITRQISVFVLLIFSYLYIRDSGIEYIDILKFSISLFGLFNLWRISLHIIFRKYRIITGSNYVTVIILGSNHNTKRLEKFFNEQLGFGYKFLGFLTNKEDANKLGNLSQSFDFIMRNNVDEIYCSVSELDDNQIREFVEFCDVNMKTLKFIPDNKELYTKNLHLNYYDIVPVLSLREIPLDDPIKSITKRVFDIVFSLIVVFFVLSWLIPVLGLIIVLESKGPIFFLQNRPGIKEQGFGCYKFRSMA